MRRILLLLTLSIPFLCYSDIDTDRTIAKIIRDTNTYLSADARESSEKAAYDKAVSELMVAINNYYTETQKPEKKISDISELTGKCSQITSKISDTRYRVLLYINKADLTGVKNAQLSEGAPADKRPAQETVKKETPTAQGKTTPTKPSQTAVAPVNPTVAKISKLQTKAEVVEAIKSLHKSKQLSGGASFPIANANDFYVVVIEGEKVVATLHFKDGQYIDTNNSNIIDITKYSNCTGYWFTLPNTK